MKKCTKCGEVKSFDCFSYDRRKKDECRSDCKACVAFYKKCYLENNRDKVRERKRKWHLDNRDKILEDKREYYKYNREYHLEYKKNYYKENKSKYRLDQKLYKRRVRHQMPKWLTFEQRREIELIYEHARECQLLTGDRYVVDHIVPLKGKNVCGLHVPWNLRVLPTDLNDSKGNKLIEELAVAHG